MCIRSHYGTSCPNSEGGTSSKVHFLVNSAAVALGPILPGQEVSVPMIMSYDFLATCSMALLDSRLAFLYLRHAISLAETLKLGDYVAPQDSVPPETLRQQRLYWLLYVHERYQSISEYRNAVLNALPSMPEHDTTVSLGVQVGFLRLVKLFTLVDDDFTENWLSRRQDGRVTPAWVITKCEAFYRDEADADAESQMLTPEQQADLTITRHWLLTLVWRMAMMNALLDDIAPEACLSLLFPVRILDRLRQAVTKSSYEAIVIHGAGIVQKLFEITDTMADVVLYVPLGSLDDSAARVDSLLFFIRLVFTLPHLDGTRKDILGAKLERLQSIM